MARRAALPQRDIGWAVVTPCTEELLISRAVLAVGY